MVLPMILRRPHDLANLFRNGRARLGWSQSVLANKLGVTRQWISLVENGKTTVEFDLVLATLQTLGYTLHMTSGDAPPTPAVEDPTLLPASDPRRSDRTSLTRDGAALDTQRAKRVRKSSGASD